jgi:hypothetical protein
VLLHYGSLGEGARRCRDGLVGGRLVQADVLTNGTFANSADEVQHEVVDLRSSSAPANRMLHEGIAPRPSEIT